MAFTDISKVFGHASAALHILTVRILNFITFRVGFKYVTCPS